MAVENLKSSAITNADATPIVFNNSRVARAPMHEAVGTAEAANAAESP